MVIITAVSLNADKGVQRIAYRTHLKGGLLIVFVDFSELRTSNTLRISFRRRGFMFIEPDGYLSLIYVRPSVRGRGNGNMMTKAARKMFPNIYTFPVSREGQHLISKYNIPTSPLQV
jgi:ribosomal protein S18 acetylase RimI-like enzyme